MEGATKAETTEDSIRALAIMTESFMENPNRVDITIGSFYPWTEYKRVMFEKDDNELFVDGKREPLNMKVDGDKNAGIIFGADKEGKNYYLYRMTANKTLGLVKVVAGVEKVLVKTLLPTGYDISGTNTVEVVREANRIYCYFNGSGKTRCYAFYKDEAMLCGNGIGLWAETEDTFFQKVICKHK